MELKIIFIVIFILASIGILVAEYLEKQKLRYLTKPLLMPSLALYYFFSSSTPDNFIIAALIFAFIGDVSLLWPWKKPFFLTGLSAFLIGHLIYIFILFKSAEYFSGNMYYLLLIIPYAFVGFIIFLKLKNYLNDMKIPVIIYMIVILFMSIVSISRACCFSGYNLYLPIIGSLFFVISDVILAFYEFRSKFPKGGVYYMSTYILAQLFIILGLL